MSLSSQIQALKRTLGIAKDTYMGLGDASAKVYGAIGKGVRDYAIKPATEALVVRPALRAGEAVGTGVAKVASKVTGNPAYYNRAVDYATKDKQVSVPGLKTITGGQTTVKAPSPRQLTGEGLETASYLYTPTRLAKYVKPTVKGIGGGAFKIAQKPIQRAAAAIGEGAFGGYMADVGFGLQDKEQSTRQALKPGFGTAIGAAIPTVGAGYQAGKYAVRQSKQLLNELGPAGAQAGFAKVPGIPDEVPKVPAKPLNAPKLEPYQDTGDLSLKTLKKLEGRSTVSKQFISDLTNSPDLKQSERDVIRQVLNGEGDTIDVPKFAEKVKAELLPLERKSSLKSMDNLDDWEGPDDMRPDPDEPNYAANVRYEGISLPDNLRGQVADYGENIYESPIKTSAGDVHFGGDSKNYFGHTRVEDMADNSTRRVIEVQSDLYQKGRLEKELTDPYRLAESPDEPAGKIFDRYGGGSKGSIAAQKESQRQAQKLTQYNDPTAHFRMVREEIKKAAQDGKTKLQFPTGETAMKIEGLGQGNNQWLGITTDGSLMSVNQNNIGVGATIVRDNGAGDMATALGSGKWKVLEVQGDGKFKAAPIVRGKVLTENAETFDISGKVDTNNPIYKFYEKDLGRYLTSKYGAKTVVDKQGVKWYELDLTKGGFDKAPVEAFGATAGIEQDEDGNIRFDPLKAVIGMGVVGGLKRTGASGFADDLIKKGKGAIDDLLTQARTMSKEEFVKGQLKLAGRDSADRVKEVLKTPISELKNKASYIEPSDSFKEATSYGFYVDGNEPLEITISKNGEKISHGYNRTKSQLTAIWEKANKKSPLSSRLSKFADPEQEIASANKTLEKRQQANAFGKTLAQDLDQRAKANLSREIKKQISEADRLIAENKLRVVSRDGKDVYQYKRGGQWVNARDESSAVNIVTRELKPRPKVELPAELEQRRIDLELKKQALAEDPARQLGKYAQGRGEFAGQLPEVTGKGKSVFARKGDDIVTEVGGYKDSEEARVAYDKFKAKKAAITEEAQALKRDIKFSREGIPLALTKREQAIIEKGKATKAGQLPRELSPELPGATPKMMPDPLPPSTRPLSTGEARSLEQVAQQTTEATSLGYDSVKTSLKSIIQSKQTPVKKKIGYLDYWRTPEPVLEKIGLAEPMKLLRKGREAIDQELRPNIDKITAWSERISKDRNKALFNYLDGKAVDLTPEELKVAGEIKSWLKQWAQRLKLPTDNQLSHYITHIFDDQLIKKEFDEDLAKIIADKVPGSVYDPFLLKRLGAKGYIEDTWRALDAYVKRATRKVHMDPALAKLEAAAEGLEESQWKYIKNYADRINMRPTEFDTLIDNSIKQSPIAYRLGQRPVANISRTLRQVTFRGMIGANVGSALRNLSQGVNTYAKLGEKYTAIGYTKVFTNGIKELREVGVLADNFVQDRQLSATKKWLEKFDKALFFFFDSAEKINRGAAYYGAKAKGISKGMSEGQAIEYAKRVVRDTQFQYGALDTPVTQALSSDTGKILSQFMTYPVKQTEFLAGMVKNKEYAGIIRYTLGGLAFTYSIGQVMGMSPSELIPWYDYVSGNRKFGTPPSLKLPTEVIKAVAGTQDEYGNDRSLSDKARDIGKTGWGIVPGGTQLKKTLEGTSAYRKGASVTPSGRVRYPIAQNPSNLVRAAAFGQYATPEARQYFNNEESILSADQSEKLLGAEDKAGYYEGVMANRDYNQAETEKMDPIKEKAKATTEQIMAKIKTNPAYQNLNDNQKEKLEEKVYNKAREAIEKKEYPQHDLRLKVKNKLKERGMSDEDAELASYKVMEKANQ